MVVPCTTDALVSYKHLYVFLVVGIVDGAGNTVEENSSVFSLIRMR